jgi:hypothetical protein
MNKRKKGSTAAIWGGVSLVLALVVVGFLNSMGATVLENTQSLQTTNGYAYNITADALTGQETIGTYQPTLATVGIFAIIIAVLMGAVAMFGKTGR